MNQKFISMLAVCLMVIGTVGCGDMGSPSNDYADFDYNGQVDNKKLVIASDDIHSTYLYTISKVDILQSQDAVYYNGDKFFKVSFKMYAPDEFADVGDIVGFTNGVIGVISTGE